MLIGLLERGEIPNFVLFADTGGEKPETYAYLEKFSAWLASRDYPAIVTVRADRTLEQDCLTRGQLPSIVFGMKSCSDHFKMRPQHRYLAERVEFPVTRLIGFDAGEAHRVRESPDKRYVNRYPLVEWGWDREACLAAIAKAGLCPPPKSSCFFCPNMRESEIIDLKEQHPDLFARAVAMEHNAKPNLTTIKGLARDMSWEQIGNYHRDQLALLPERPREMPCECWDGGE